jgi:hypothetical protein
MQSLGNLAILHVFNVLQHDHSAMLWRNLCKRPVDVLPHLTSFAVNPGTGKIRGNCFVKFYLLVPAFPAERVNRQI